jgi:hypothetical protein
MSAVATSTEDRTVGAKLLTGGILAVIGLVAVKLVLVVLKGVAALVGFLLFTVLPIVVIGWLVLRIFGKPKEPGWQTEK